MQVRSVVYQDLFNTAYVLASVGRLFSFSIVDADHKKTTPSIGQKGT